MQLLITILVQFFIMKDVEKIAGWLRVSIIYLGSGIMGNLGSSIFLPYQAEVGPTGSLVGILASVFLIKYYNDNKYFIEQVLIENYFLIHSII